MAEAESVLRQLRWASGLGREFVATNIRLRRSCSCAARITRFWGGAGTMALVPSRLILRLKPHFSGLLTARQKPAADETVLPVPLPAR